MSAYYAILEHQPGTLRGVWFPDLPGCVAAGRSDEEAIQNAIAALRDFIETASEDDPLPAPSEIAALKTRDDVEEAFAESQASFVRIPLLVNENTPVRINVSLDAGVLKAVDIAAKQHGMTRSGFLAAAASEKIIRTA